jgi:hypothetical protein
MVQPIALCIEYLDARSRADRFLCCVATPGYDVALGFDETGQVVWRDDTRLAHELWVSADQQLMVVRRPGRPEIVVTRAGRSLSLPFDKPVVLLDCDRVDVQGTRLRVHVHGATEHVAAPSPLEQERSAGTVAAIATAVAITASAIGCKPSADANEATSATVVADPVVPEAGPELAAPEDAGAVAMDAAEVPAASVTGSASAAPVTAPTRKPPIEVRVQPPKPVAPRRDGGTEF